MSRFSDQHKMDSPPPKRHKNDYQLFAILPDDLIAEIPLVKAYCGTVAHRKFISQIVVCLNKNLPAPELSHLKRVKNDKILLTLANDVENDIGWLKNQLQARGVQPGWLLDDEITIEDVPGAPPKTKAQFQKAILSWPCNFHPDKHVEKLVTNTLFGNKEMEKHVQYMQCAVTLAKQWKKLHKLDKTSSAIVVDPKHDTIVAIGVDCTSFHPLKHSIMVAVDNVAKTQDGGAWKSIGFDRINEGSETNDYSEQKNNSIGVDNAMNTEDMLCKTNANKAEALTSNECKMDMVDCGLQTVENANTKHENKEETALTLEERSIETVECKLLTTQNAIIQKILHKDEKDDKNEIKELCFNDGDVISNKELDRSATYTCSVNGVPETIKNFLHSHHPDVKFGSQTYKSKESLDNPEDGPYLCTNYYVYVTHEPCVMCSMALVHSRAKRVFYGTKNVENGGLGSTCKVHCVKDLNHHFEAFSGLLEHECALLQS